MPSGHMLHCFSVHIWWHSWRALMWRRNITNVSLEQCYICPQSKVETSYVVSRASEFTLKGLLSSPLQGSVAERDAHWRRRQHTSRTCDEEVPNSPCEGIERKQVEGEAWHAWTPSHPGPRPTMHQSKQQPPHGLIKNALDMLQLITWGTSVACEHLQH